MMSIIYSTFLVLATSLTTSNSSMETISFKASDGIMVTADLYMPHENTAPFIILFHQANWSRGEYSEISPKLNAMGFNCMAVDQRSGGSINGVNNLTKLAATKAMKGTSYVDALIDMKAAIAFAQDNFAGGKLILLGSSYSAALVIQIAGEEEVSVDGVLAFSPGEYFSNLGKSKDFVTNSAKNIQNPVFITSSKDEKRNWWGIYEAIPSESKQYYLPQSSGNHGSRALWGKFTDSKGYWDAVTIFLGNFQ